MNTKKAESFLFFIVYAKKATYSRLRPIQMIMLVKATFQHLFSFIYQDHHGIQA